MKYWWTGLLLLSLNGTAQSVNKKGFHYVAQDSVITPVTQQYEIRSLMHRLIMGKNYRESWEAPVRLPVFYLSNSGLKIEKLGGGQQTKSLRLKDKEGKEWVLRTVNKTVKDAIPPGFRNPLVEKVVQDMISASHPYSPLVVAELARQAGIIAPVPTYYFVAHDPALGAYNSIFANSVCMLEQREPTPDGSDTDDTEEIKEKIVKENENIVLQRKVLKARLLDMLVGDWDRHADQWRWDEIDSSGFDYYYAIPRDRDNALFHSGGLLPALAKLTFMPHITGFKKKSSGLKKLNKKSHDFDRIFLNELDAGEWKQIITEFQHQISDAVIEASVKKLPSPIYSLDGEEMISKLKSRRDGLMKHAMRYYEFLSNSVNINGTEEEELFIISGEGKKLVVKMYRINDDGKEQLYERTFHPSETAYVYLYGLGGNDRFVIEPGVTSRIRLRLLGNEGNDVYDIRGKTKSRIYDLAEGDADANPAFLNNYLRNQLNQKDSFSR